MSTRTCGIYCDVCRLNFRGICSSCGGGTSELARLKLEAQEALLGAICLILACARINRLDFCMRDCQQFPCENFSGKGLNSYPFGEGFLNMQRRKWASIKLQDQQSDHYAIPEQHWKEISGRGLDKIRRFSGADLVDDGCLLLQVLEHTPRIDPKRKTVGFADRGKWPPTPSLIASGAAAIDLSQR